MTACSPCEKVELSIAHFNDRPKFVAVGKNSVHSLTESEHQKLNNIYQSGVCYYEFKSHIDPRKSTITQSGEFYFLSIGKDVFDTIVFDVGCNIQPGKYVFKEERALEELCKEIVIRTQKPSCGINHVPGRISDFTLIGARISKASGSYSYVQFDSQKVAKLSPDLIAQLQKMAEIEQEFVDSNDGIDFTPSLSGAYVIALEFKNTKTNKFIRCYTNFTKDLEVVQFQKGKDIGVHLEEFLRRLINEHANP